MNNLNKFQNPIIKDLIPQILLLEQERLDSNKFKIDTDWFRGFSEAECTFSGSKKQPMFQLTQHPADYALLLAISNFIGHGNVYITKRSKGKLICTLTITKKSILLFINKIIPIFNGIIYSTKKRDQFTNWISKYFPDVKLKNKEELKNIPAPSWVSGLSDGDGSFFLVVNKAKGYKCGYQVRLFYDITQIETEISILEKIGKNHFGNIHKLSQTKNILHFRITGIKDINNFVVPYFSLNPLCSRKKIDFFIWKEILKLVNLNKHITIEGIQIIKELRELQNYFRTNITPSVQRLLNSLK